MFSASGYRKLTKRAGGAAGAGAGCTVLVLCT